MSAGWLSNYLFALIAGLCLILSSESSGLKVKPNEYLLIIFAVLAYVNLSFHIEDFQAASQLSSLAVAGYLLTYKIGKNLKEADLKIIVYLSALEAVALSVSSFRPLLQAMTQMSEVGWHQGLLHFYQNRGSGLLGSIGLSGFAVLIGFLLLDHSAASFSRREKQILYPILAIGLLFNMSRAAALSLILFFAFKTLTSDGRLVLLLRRYWLLVFAGFCTIFYAIKGYISNVDLSELSSGRTVIYKNALTYIDDHILFGMGSWRYYDFSYVAEGIHAHNSFLELWATHGILSLILMIFIVKRISSKNHIYLLPIFVFSLMNFSIFYVFSFGDVVMFYFLSIPQKDLDL